MFWDNLKHVLLEISSGGILSGGILEWGDIVRGDFVLGGYCPGGYCPGGYCPDTIASGVSVCYNVCAHRRQFL